MLIASFRMYEAGPKAAAAWRALFEAVFRDAELDIAIVEHRWPEPIATLWSKPELGCAFMCGWPFVRASPSMRPLAAPVPSPARYASLPRYCSEFLVRAASGIGTLEDAFSMRFGWMAGNSQSGYNAPRAHLVRQFGPQRAFAEVRGPLGTPARTLAALRTGEVDLVAVDSFYLDLARKHEPQALEGLVPIAQTPWTPIPLLVASPGTDDDTVAKLRARLTSLHDDPPYAPLLAEAVLERFVATDVEAYRMLDELARDSDRLQAWS